MANLTAQLEDGGTIPPRETPAEQPAQRDARRKRSADRFAMLNSFVDRSMTNLPKATIAVWLSLFRHTQKNGLARVSQSRLAESCGISNRTVSRAVGALVKRGLVKVVRPGNPTNGIAVYRVRARSTARGKVS